MFSLCFFIDRIPDLTLAKYSVFDGSSVQDLMEKHGVFLRQLYRLGFTSNVYFHLLFNFDPTKIKGTRLSIILYATAEDRKMLQNIRAFISTSSLSPFYHFQNYEIIESIEEMSADSSIDVDYVIRTVLGEEYRISKDELSTEEYLELKDSLCSRKAIYRDSCDTDLIHLSDLEFDEFGKIVFDKSFLYSAYVTKKSFSLEAINRLDSDNKGTVNLFSIMDWIACDNGRLFQVLKLMEGYNQPVALRIDLFPVENSQLVRNTLPYAETRKRVSKRDSERDTNSEYIIRTWDNITTNLNKHPQFYANIVSMSNYSDIAVMLADSVAAEAVESGSYEIHTIEFDSGVDVYFSDSEVLSSNPDYSQSSLDPNDKISQFLSLFTLEELRPMFSLPILYPGESIELQKETEPILNDEPSYLDKITGSMFSSITIGKTINGYDVTVPINRLNRHAFIGGVPGAGKTNTMLKMITSLWRDNNHHIPFLVFEPAKQEYRALLKIQGMEDVLVFAPGADTKFPLHINPFEFPEGLTLDEHIKNLNRSFEGAFPLIMPAPMFIDRCIQRAYTMKGWNIYERNTCNHPYPTLQEFFDLLREEVQNSTYQGEVLGNIIGILEVRVGSLLNRSIGTVFNVRSSTIKPHEWINLPVIVELEALGEGPSNFLTLLISTYIRETLKIEATQKTPIDIKSPIKHIIFYEEAHNLIGNSTNSPDPLQQDPKTSATKFLVKMLAEVRALGEGIVIADQLPSEMAPQVMKNTGLKIGHRLVAIDDRTILGSTMSASNDQIEEQGTFTTGQALVYYEGLQKPFIAKIDEWEPELDHSKYDSPSDDELFECCKNRPSYQKQIDQSIQIINRRIADEYNSLYSNVASIIKKLDLLNQTRNRDINIISKLNNGEEVDAKEQQRYSTILETHFNKEHHSGNVLSSKLILQQEGRSRPDINYSFILQLVNDQYKQDESKLKNELACICDKICVFFESYCTFAKQYVDKYDKIGFGLTKKFHYILSQIISASSRYNLEESANKVSNLVKYVTFNVINNEIIDRNSQSFYMFIALKINLLTRIIANSTAHDSGSFDNYNSVSDSLIDFTRTTLELSLQCELLSETRTVLSQNINALCVCLINLVLHYKPNNRSWFHDTIEARKHIRSALTSPLFSGKYSSPYTEIVAYIAKEVNGFYSQEKVLLTSVNYNALQLENELKNVSDYFQNYLFAIRNMLPSKLILNILSNHCNILKLVHSKFKIFIHYQGGRKEFMKMLAMVEYIPADKKKYYDEYINYID